MFLFVVSWQTLNTRRGDVDASRTSRSAPSRGQFQWSFEYLPADADGRYQPLFTSPRRTARTAA